MSTARWVDRASIALFLAALVAPAADALIRSASERDCVRERRLPAELPPLPEDIATLGTWPSRFQAHFDDTFGLRDVLLDLHQRLSLFVFRIDPTAKVVLGRDDWLFLGANEAASVFRGVNPATLEHLEEWRAHIEERRAWARGRGIEYVFALTPCKETIYPEHYPARQDRLGPSRREQFVRYMREHSDVEVIDLHDALLAERARDAGDDLAFYRLGSHWTNRGAWSAARVLVHELAERFPAVAELRREDYGTNSERDEKIDSLTAMMYVGDALEQGAFRFERLQPEANERTALPRLFLSADSFGTWVIPFLMERTSKLSFTVAYTFPAERILADRSDVVVELFNEYWLTRSLPAIDEGFDLETREDFERHAPLFGPVDPTSGPPAVTAIGRITTGVRTSGSNPALEFEMHSHDARFVIAGPPPPSDSRAVVHVVIDSPAELDMLLGYSMQGESGFARTHVIPLGLHAGRNDLYVRLLKYGVGGSFLLRVPLGHKLVLSELEVRAAR
jgi:hypothetical protein